VEERTSFCEQKEAKKLYEFQCRDVSASREAEQKFFGSFFSKKNSLLLLTLVCLQRWRKALRFSALQVRGNDERAVDPAGPEQRRGAG
jgi:hypothetical protein